VSIKQILIKAIIILTIIPLVTTLCYQPPAYAAEVGNYRLAARGAIAIDFETGDELFSHNADVIRPSASMTKMMSVYLVYEAISQGLIDYDTIVPISSFVMQIVQNPGETNVPLTRSGTYTVSELLDATIAVSAGGAIRALAELVGGSYRDFIRMMNEKVAEWEIDARFFSASGGSNTRMTPRAMATITRNTIMEFPEVLEKTSKPTIDFKGRTYENTNTLFGSYEGIDGFKTGTNNAGGANFSGTAQRGDIRIIVVVMGSTHGSRFRDTTALLDYGFAIMEERHLEARKITPSKSTIILNGKIKLHDAYTIENEVYISIRDLAYISKDTPIEFDVEINNTSIQINTEAEYTVVSGEMSGDSEERVLPVLSDKTIIVDGDEKEFPVYEIEDKYVIRLSDIANINDIDAVWKEEFWITFINAAEEEPPPPEEEIIQTATTVTEDEYHTIELEQPAVDINIVDEEPPPSQPLLLYSGICALGILIIIPCIYVSKKRQKKKRYERANRNRK